MQAIRTTLLTLLIIGLVAPAAIGEEQGSPRGFTTSLDLGVNFLVPPTKDKQIFEDFDPHFGMALGLGYRFSELAALRFAFKFGMYDLPDAPGVSTYGRFIALDLGPRFYIQAGPVDVFIDLGTGWSLFSSGVSGGGISSDTSLHALDLSLGGGAEYRIMPGLSAGLGIGYHFPFYIYACIEVPNASKECDTAKNQKLNRTPGNLLLAATITVNWGKLFSGGKSSEPEIAPGGRSSLPGGGSGGTGQPAPKAGPASASGDAGAVPSGPSQRRLIPSAFTARQGSGPLVSLGNDPDEVIDALEMPAKMDQVGYNTRFTYPGSARGLSGFRQVILLFNQDKELFQVEMSPEQGISQATIREKLGEPTKKQQSSKGVIVWYYKAQKLAFYFKPGTDQAYHVRHKAF